MSSRTQQRSEVLDQRIVSAIGHPIRLDVLRLLGERTASPKELAQELGEPVGKVSHHVRVLADKGFLSLVDTAQRRGATEHYYRATARANITNEIAAQLPKAIRDGVSATMLEAIVELLVASLEDDTFDARSDRHLSWMKLELDEQGWNELIALKAEQLEREMEIAAESAERLAASGEKGFPAVTVGMCFEASSGT